jgi:septum formation inhibitor MinC
MKTNNNSSELSAFELKGSVLTVMVLHVREVDPDLLSSQLRKKINQSRAFFKNAPVIIDLKGTCRRAAGSIGYSLACLHTSRIGAGSRRGSRG